MPQNDITSLFSREIAFCRSVLTVS